MSEHRTISASVPVELAKLVEQLVAEGPHRTRSSLMRELLEQGIAVRRGVATVGPDAVVLSVSKQVGARLDALAAKMGEERGQPVRREEAALHAFLAGVRLCENKRVAATADEVASFLADDLGRPVGAHEAYHWLEERFVEAVELVVGAYRERGEEQAREESA